MVISNNAPTFAFMASKKPDIKLRIRKDRLDLLKDMHEVLNERIAAVDGKRISFNRFVEDMIEGFLVSKAGLELCDAVDEKRKVRSDGWKAERTENAMSEEDF